MVVSASFNIYLAQFNLFSFHLYLVDRIIKKRVMKCVVMGSHFFHRIEENILYHEVYRY